MLWLKNIVLDQGVQTFFQEGQIDNVKVIEGQERSLKKRSLLRFDFKFRYISPRIVVISKKKKKKSSLRFHFKFRYISPRIAVARHNTLTGQNTLCFSDRSEKKSLFKKIVKCQRRAGSSVLAGRSLATPVLDNRYILQNKKIVVYLLLVSKSCFIVFSPAARILYNVH